MTPSEQLARLRRIRQLVCEAIRGLEHALPAYEELAADPPYPAKGAWATKIVAHLRRRLEANRAQYEALETEIKELQRLASSRPEGEAP